MPHVLRQTARAGLLVLVAFALGCSSVPIQPAYTEQQLKQECERRGGRWHANDLRGGFCEYNSRG
ncbi:MAG TPA: hypothetical protein VGT40_13870 [Methylomirabilota bacterium]|jgi:hypothetical protein|nr:hypothetical protein [Methylomirabilota bacterium]